MTTDVKLLKPTSELPFHLDPANPKRNLVVARTFIHKFKAPFHCCIIIAWTEAGRFSSKNDRLVIVDHTWDCMPDNARLARTPEWFSWTNECYSILDAQFGKGSVEQAKHEHSAVWSQREYNFIQQPAFSLAPEDAPVVVCEVDRRAFDYEEKSYVCAILTRAKQGILQNVEFVWNRLPPHLPATLEGEKEWACKCKAEIEEKYGVGSVARAGSTGTVVDKTGYSKTSLECHTSLRVWVILGLTTYKPIKPAGHAFGCLA